ncbi:MAG TPA: SDR family NAD(P)-dependent oxidoreductase [Solirubrobacteraceae bacterium]|nr:SDR family NAD(P)-dependent oxidoreductase [Solirubrobacteraceae bacterium]
MKVVVTGGAGFIGSHVVDALLAAGATVHVLDNLSSGRPANLATALERGAELHTVDVTDEDETVRVMTVAGPRVVIHLAAQIDVRRSVDRPAFDATVNVAGTAAVLEAARRAGVARVVLASTAAVYGQPDRLPTPERAPLRPLTPYGTAKAAAEAYCELYRRLYGLSTLALRMANVYGPRQDPHGESGVVAIFNGAAAERRPVTVHGDGHQTRDYVHVDDVARAFLLATATAASGAVNIATGRETSVWQLAELLGVEVLQGPGRVGEIPRSCLDPAAANRRLGWSARMPLQSGLASLRAVPAERV